MKIKITTEFELNHPNPEKEDFYLDCIRESIKHLIYRNLHKGLKYDDIKVDMTKE